MLAAARAAQEGNADDFLIVDCLLPAQVRQLGMNMTFLAPRQAIRSAAHECAVRGGEFARGDAGGPAGLKVWLPAAQKGDPEAQTYVGEIFERGLGGQPDYAAAVQWYRRAADQNFARAQISLGSLVAQGLGTARDPIEAAKLFRRAAGLPPDLPIGNAAQDQRVAELNSKLAAANAADAAKQQRLSAQDEQLRQLRQKLNARESDAKRERDRLQNLQRKLEQSQAPPPDRSAQADDTKKALAERDRELQRTKQSVAELQTKLAAAETAEAKNAVQPAQLDQMRSNLASAQAAMAAQQDEATRLRKELQAQSASSSTRDKEYRETVEKLEKQVSDRQAGLAAKDEEINRLKSQVAKLDEEPKSRSGGPATAMAPLPPVAIPVVEFGRYHALVIGINNYRRLPKLETPINDAKDVSQVLQSEYGFDVTTLIDPDRYQMLSALNHLRQTLTDKDNLLIYYAGHGVLDSVNQRGNWLPVDAEPDSTANWISNIQVTDILNAMAARQILVVADSCYSGTLTRDVTTVIDHARSDLERVKWYRIMISRPSRVALTSGGLEPVLDSSGGKHSLFAQLFLQALRKNTDAIATQELYREIEPVVATRTADLKIHQVPEYAPIKMAGHEAGDFVFVKHTGTP
jgi:uncharacterized caspase-like protein